MRHEGFPKPLCARCQREVDRMTVTRDLAADRLTFAVECHGAELSVVVDGEFLDAGPVTMVPVFQERPALPEAP